MTDATQASGFRMPPRRIDLLVSQTFSRGPQTARRPPFHLQHTE